MTAKVEQEAAIAKIAQFTANAEAIRRHLAHILESQSFKGSRRSQEFLRYIVEKSLRGDFDEIKERILGIEIFGRAVNYDTSADSIVRVTANDVRKRLLRYYELEGANSEFRIDLPSGSYLPEFSRSSPDLPLIQIPSDSEMTAIVQPANPAKHGKRGSRTRLATCAAAIFVLGISLGLAIRIKSRPQIPKLIVPWSALFQSGLPTQIIFCDTSIEMLQEYLHSSISLSDYANRRLLSNSGALRPYEKRAASMLGGPDFTVTTAPVDLGISMRIAELAQPYSHHLRVRSARELHFRDFKNDGNFILLGSPRSNPWTGLFQDQLDFYFAYDATRKSEVCYNRHPKAGELSVYVPTAMGGGTGEAFAIAAFTRNPDQNGNVLILAGSNAEGTEASARFATDLNLLSRALHKYGVDPTALPSHFEALLRLTTMAGSPNRFEVIALHPLDDALK
jgi:hypothetical protein